MKVPYTARRVGQSLITILLIVVINFAVLNLAPGDAADVLAGESGSADPVVLAAMREQMGLDRPLPVQFVKYMGRLFTLDLGMSAQSQESVFTLLIDRLPATLLLMLPALALAFIGGCALGVLSAIRVNTWVDVAISLVSLIAYAMPLFWLGLMLIVFFTLKLGWLPSGGMGRVGADFTTLAGALDLLRHLTLPVFTLSLFYMAIYARLMRASMLEVEGLGFVRTARAKGLREWRVVWRHVIRNALLPVITMLGMHVGAILGGAVVIEAVFTWPGLGSLAYDSVFKRDNTVLLGLLFFCSLLVVIVNLAVDLLYGRLDPRVRMGSAR